MSSFEEVQHLKREHKNLDYFSVRNIGQILFEKICELKVATYYL